ncbi:MAG: hypothetical protein C0617_10650 [Desulfuromonas sp.]|uniref:tandem-95 repeat protein n=1 Tax=Desulfuromonas sp. TaxID=892 RepID=UPI000CB2D9C5|nr:Ig-like domain-containing protein [Desulfuromonas sp.]PLX83591.1 MAG: hypothetical protein C0617_10650 [Desulfuromonas sp.]
MTAEFTVVLKVAPTAAVTIDVSSSDLSEGTVDVSQLTFTSDDWDIPKTVIVTGVDDALSDGKRVYTIVLDPGGSTDVVYAAIDPAEVAVNNLDNEPFPGITVGALSGDTSEGGTSATFTVVLDTEPSAEVTVAVTSLDTSEGTVDVPSLTFTPENWDTPREVTVTGVDDTFKDGDVTYDVRLDPAVSDDNAYAGIDPDDVSVTNADDEVAGVTLGNGTFGIIADASGEGSEPGSAVRLTFLNNAWGTTENPFLGTDFTVVLDSAPTADVTITIASSDPTEGTVLPTELTFTPGNGTVPQTVTVTGVDDDVLDGDVTYTLTLTAASGDANYDNLFLPDVTVTNQDNELSGVTLTPITGDTGEDGTTATFTVALDTAPTEPVTIGVTSSDTTEGTVSPEELTFTAADWSTSQTVTVTGADDAIADGDVAYTIILAPAVSMDPAYGGIDPADVLVTNVDDEAPGLMPGISVGAISGDTSEEGATATFTVVLDTAPSEDVTIGVTSNDLTEGTVDKATLTFTSSNWDTPQTVTVTGVADALDDGNIDYKVILAPAVSLDAAYAGIDPADVGLTNRDAAAELITVGPVSGDTAEDGTQATFTVVLGQAPTADVSIALSSSDLSEGIVSPAELTFTPANWETPQTVTVTGVDDTVDDGDVAFTIVTAPAVSADTAFSGRDTADVELANVDDEIIEIVASAVSGDTKEDGTTATFTVVLGTTPTAEVTVAVSSSDTSEGTVLPASLTFTPTNALTPQTVTVTGVDDTVDDDDTAYTVVLAAASSSDTDYNTLDPDDVAVTNLDDDTAGITVGAVSGDTAEDGTTATFTVVLDTVPTANVTVAVSSSNTAEGTVSPTSLIFTPANALSPQTVTVTGADDDLDDGDVDYTVVLAAAVSTDGKYNTVDPSDVPATNLDDDETPVVTAAQSFSVAENSAATTSVGTAAATDGDAGTTFQAWTITTNANPDGDADLAFAIDPATGAITVNDAGDLDRETNASLTVSVTVSDGANTSAPETLTVNITDVNDVAPEVTAAQTFTVPENSPQATAVGTAAATDGDTSPTTFQGWAITVNPNPDGDSDLAFAIDPATGAITVNDPGDLDYESNPSLTVSLTVSDGVNTSAAQTAVVNLTEVNDAPTIDSAVPAAATENVEYSYTPAVTDPDGPGATWSVLAADTCGGAFAAGIYAFTPGDDPPADCVVSVQVCDGGTPEECAEQSAAVTITAVNDAPIIGSAVPAAATENVEYSYTPAVTDPDGPGANWSVLGDDTCGGAFAAGSYAFTPGDDPAADCLVSIRVCDGGTPEECAEQSGAVTITAVNDAPTIDSAPPAAATENVEYSYTPAVTDPDGHGTTWSVLAADTCGGAFAAGSYAFTPGDAPATDCLVSIRVCDGGTPEECGEQSGTVTITAVNDAPVATDDGISIREDNSITFSPLGNDFDVDGDVLTIVAVTNPAHGRVTDNGNRTVTYTPAPNYNGSDTFSYTNSDGKATDSATASITVAAVNDPPVITGQNAAFTVPQGGSFTFDISDLDVVDPDDTVFTLGVRPGLHYTVNGNTVTAANSYFGTLRVSVAVHDGTTASSPFEVIVTVVDGNPPTVAADPAGGVFKDEVSVVLTAEDNEDPNPTITYSLDGGAPTTPYGAALTIEESLTLRYAAEDADGNRSDTQEAVFTIDTDSPVIVLSTLVGVVTTEEVLNVSGIVTDDVGVKSLTVNGETVPVGTGGSFSTAVALKVGANEVIVVATDAVDRATTETFSVSRDTGAPKLAVTAPADGSVVDGATLTVTGTADAGATVSVALNGGDPLLAERDGEAFAASVTLKPVLNTIGVVAVAGDKASVAKRTVTLGENQLSLTITEPAQDRIAYGKNLALKGVFDSPDPASVAIALGEETFTPALNGEGAFTQALTFAEKGTYAVVVTGTDASGETVSAVRNVIFDPPPLGDIDGNGQLTTWDLILISKFILGVDTLTERQKVAADVNDDGVITTLDMIIIRKVILGIDPPFDS